MTLVFSTSSPLTSLAWVDGQEIVWSSGKLAPRRASGALMELLADSPFPLNQAKKVIVDLGPGSFTGVRVGVTMAKMWAWTLKIPCAGVSSFDLINPNLAAKVPGGRREVWLREPGQEPIRVPSENATHATGYATFDSGDFPHVAQILKVEDQKILEAPPEKLTPIYLAEPNISTAKQKHIMGETFTDV